MKIRTDFVTNSSSSSFIFSSKTDMNKLYKHFHTKALQYKNMAEPYKDNDNYSNDDYYSASTLFEHIEKYVVTPDKLNIDEIMEILSWYSWDTAEEIVQQNNFDINNIKDEDLNILFADLLTDLVTCFGNEDKKTLEHKENELLYEVWEQAYLDEIQLEIISKHYDKWVDFFNKYKMEPYKLLVDLLDCKYVFFESEMCQIDIVAKALSEYETCIHYCNHMG